MNLKKKRKEIQGPWKLSWIDMGPWKCLKFVHERSQVGIEVQVSRHRCALVCCATYCFVPCMQNNERVTLRKNRKMSKAGLTKISRTITCPERAAKWPLHVTLPSLSVLAHWVLEFEGILDPKRVIKTMNCKPEDYNQFLFYIRSVAVTSNVLLDHIMDPPLVIGLMVCSISPTSQLKHRGSPSSDF